MRQFQSIIFVFWKVHARLNMQFFLGELGLQDHAWGDTEFA